MRRSCAAFIFSMLLVGSSMLSAPAEAKLTIALSEQNAAVFSEPQFPTLGMKKVRVAVAWNVALRPDGDYDKHRFDMWMAGARAQGVQPHVVFNIASYDPAKRRHLPSTARYTKAVKAFRARYPDVRDYAPWNEANHHTQPTARHPKRAAQYYNILRRECRGCTVLGADVLDQPGLEKWLKTFKRHTKRSPRHWGLHNYQDSNNKRSIKKSYTYKMTKLVKGEIWATETGGIVRHSGETGQINRSYNPKRAAASMKHLFTLIKHPSVRKRYTRVYVYNWYGTSTGNKSFANRWDSGLFNVDGTARPALGVVIRELDRAKQRPAVPAVPAVPGGPGLPALPAVPGVIG